MVKKGRRSIKILKGEGIKVNILLFCSNEGFEGCFFSKVYSSKKVILYAIMNFLKKTENKDFILVSDNASYQKSVFKNEKISSVLDVFFLPAYFSFLNPIEEIFSDLKRILAKENIQDEKNLKLLAASILRRDLTNKSMSKKILKSLSCWVNLANFFLK